MAVRPLSFLAPGEEAVVVDINGGRGLQAKLTGMGLAPGKKVRMVSLSHRGPAVVAMNDTRLAIGRGQLHAVLVDDER